VRLSRHLPRQLAVSLANLCPALLFLPSDTSPLALRI
jgi:hypothetical protein